MEKKISIQKIKPEMTQCRLIQLEKEQMEKEQLEKANGSTISEADGTGSSRSNGSE